MLHAKKADDVAVEDVRRDLEMAENIEEVDNRFSPIVSSLSQYCFSFVIHIPKTGFIGFVLKNTIIALYAIDREPFMRCLCNFQLSLGSSFDCATTLREFFAIKTFTGSHLEILLKCGPKL